MYNIVFVDDEQNILSALRRKLHTMRDEWNISLCNGGDEALELLRKEEQDVIVTDMLMPDMNGVELLEKVRQHYPDMIRMCLSGQMDEDLNRKNTVLSHQFLAKPCETEDLVNRIRTCLELREILTNQEISSIVAKTSTLPSLPRVYHDLVRELENSHGTIKAAGEIISQDMGMTAKILQIVNSAYFGLPRKISDPAEAASYLGIETLKGLVLVTGVFSQFEQDKYPLLNLEELQSRSMSISALAGRIAKYEKLDRQSVEYAQVAAMLMSVGQVVLITGFPDEYSRASSLAGEHGMSPWAAEQQVFNCTHTDIAAYMLGLWGLPKPVIETVKWTCNPGMCNGDVPAPLLPVHVASALHASDRLRLERNVLMDQGFINKCGLSEHLEAWQKLFNETETSGAQE